MYNVSGGNILKRDGSVLLSVNREAMSRLFHLEEQQFVDLTPTLFMGIFLEKANIYRNTIVKSWTEAFYKGGSRLPKTLKKYQMTTQVWVVIVLLHRIFRSPNVFVFKDWM